MKDLVLVGCGDFGRETTALVKRINENSSKPQFNLLGYIDDDKKLKEAVIEGTPVIGDINWLDKYDKPISAVCTISGCQTKKKIIEKIANTNVEFATLIDPSVVFLGDYNIGEGTIICANTVLTVNVSVGKHNIINLSCTLGHDVQTADYCSIMPGSNISGKVKLEECVFIGTGAKVIQGYSIGNNTTVGAGAVVNRDITENCTAVGVPASPVKYGGGISNSKILIHGASGHGKVVADIASNYYSEIAFVDDDRSLVGKVIGEYPVIGDSKTVLEEKNSWDVFVAIGDNATRHRLIQKYKKEGIELVTLIHPNATITENVSIGVGTVVMASAVINSDTMVGDGVIVNTSASIDHDCIIGECVHISPGANISGTVTIDDYTWIGVGASVSNNINIGSNCVIGAGAVVIREVFDNCIAVGIPTKVIK